MRDIIEWGLGGMFLIVSVAILATAFLKQPKREIAYRERVFTCESGQLQVIERSLEDLEEVRFVCSRRRGRE